MPAYRAKPPFGNRLRAGDPYARHLTAAWLFHERGGTVLRASHGGKRFDGTFTGTPVFTTGVFGRCVRFTDITHYADVGSIDSVFPSGTDATILLLHRKTDTTLRGSAAFGESAGASLPARAGAHLPFSDGNVYFDWGGATNGTSRLTVSGLTWDTLWHCYVFTVGGGLGMRLYKDGKLVGSNSGTPTRSGGSNWRLNQGNAAAGGDLADFAAALTFKRALNAKQVAELSADVSRAFRPRRLPVPLRVSTGNRRRRVLLCARAA